MIPLNNPAKILSKSLRVTLVFVMQLLLCFSFICTTLGIATANAASWHWVTYEIAQASTESLDVDRAAEKADEASEDIYKGLDTTKRIIGKTDKRNQIIEEAREHASQKWKSLAEKAKAAQNSETSLSPTEKQVLKQVQN